MVIEQYNDFEKACINGDLDTVKMLLPENVNYCINYEISMDGETPLILTILNKHTAIVKLLLDNNADPNLKSDVGPFTSKKFFEGTWSTAPLDSAASKGVIEIAKSLIDYGADLNCLYDSGFTALYIATACRDTAMVEFLLRQGANPNLFRPSGVLSNIPLFCAARDREIEILKLLLKYGADINATNQDNENALFWTWSIESNAELIHAGINVNLKNTKGETALKRAKRLEKSDVVTLLKKHGAI
jgi:ankyrin repeat protein